MSHTIALLLERVCGSEFSCMGAGEDGGGPGGGPEAGGGPGPGAAVPAGRAAGPRRLLGGAAAVRPGPGRLWVPPTRDVRVRRATRRP